MRKVSIMTILILIFLSIILQGENHPTSSVIAAINARWDGGYPIYFGVIGDNYDSNRIFKAVLNQIEYISDSIDFIITTGDHTGGGDSLGYYQYLSAIDTLTVPWLTTIGNHEMNDSLGWNRFIEFFGYPDFCLDIGDFRFISLTNCYPAPGPVSGWENVYYKFESEQLDWFESKLSEWDGHKFVFIHAPPYLDGHIIIGTLGSYGYSPGYEESLTERFTDIIRDNNVYICFCGHIHCFDRWKASNEQYGNVTYIITGGAGGTLCPWFYGEPYGGTFYHFMLMELYEDGTLFGHMIFPDTVEDGVTTIEYDEIYSFELEPPVGISQKQKILDEISKPYPNPFNSAVVVPVSYETKRITVCDISGKTVAVINHDGTGIVHWKPDLSVSSGFYFIQGNKILFIR